MASTFAGFSEDDLRRIKTGTSYSTNAVSNEDIDRKLAVLDNRLKRQVPRYKLPKLENLNSDDSIEDMEFEKCKLSIKTPTSPSEETIPSGEDNKDGEPAKIEPNPLSSSPNSVTDETDVSSRKSSTVATPDIVRSLDNYTEDEVAAHKVKLEALQLQQRIMEEQNKKRKEMLAKALADR